MINGDENAVEPGLPPIDPKRVSLLWAIQAHAPAIASLHARLFPEAWDAAAISGLLNHPGSIALVASQGGGNVIGGFALAQVAADEAEVLTLGVAPEWRRHGVARQLVEGIKRAASRSGAASIFLEVAASNRSAISLYQSCGFKEAGRRKGYYQRHASPPEDAVVLKSVLAT